MSDWHITINSADMPPGDPDDARPRRNGHKRPTDDRAEIKGEREVAAHRHVQRKLGQRDGDRILRRIIAAEQGREPVDFEWMLDQGTMYEMYQQDFPDSDHIVDGLLARRGCVALAGPGKAGKTSAAIDLMRSLLAGEKWLRHFPTSLPPDASIGYINCEIDKGMFVGWCKRHGITDEQAKRLRLLSVEDKGMNLLDEVFYEDLRSYIKATGIEVLFLDSLSRLIRNAGLTENEDGDALVEAVKGLRDGTELKTIVFIAHYGKVKWSDIVSGGPPDVRGHSAIRDTVDGTIHLVRDQIKNRRFMMAFGREMDVSWGEIVTRLDPHPDREMELTWDPSSTPAGDNSEDEEEIIYARKRHAATVAEVREALVEAVGKKPGILKGDIRDAVRAIRGTASTGNLKEAYDEAWRAGDIVVVAPGGNRLDHYLPDDVPEEFADMVRDHPEEDSQ